MTDYDPGDDFDDDDDGDTTPTPALTLAPTPPHRTPPLSHARLSEVREALGTAAPGSAGAEALRREEAQIVEAWAEATLAVRGKAERETAVQVEAREREAASDRRAKDGKIGGAPDRGVSGASWLAAERERERGRGIAPAVPGKL